MQLKLPLLSFLKRSMFEYFYVNYEFRQDQTLVNFSIFWCVFSNGPVFFFQVLFSTLGGASCTLSHVIHRTLWYFASCKLKQFLQTRFSQSFSHRRIIENSFLLLPDSLTLFKSYWIRRCLKSDIHPLPPNFIKPFLQNTLSFKDPILS